MPTAVLSSSRVAIKVGVTTFIEHPNTLPPIDNSSRVEAKARLLESKAYMDFALLGMLHDGDVHEFEDMLEAGVVGFKFSWVQSRETYYPKR